MPYARVACWALWGSTAADAQTDAEWGADVVCHHAATERVTVGGRKLNVARDTSRRGLVALMRPAHGDHHAA